MQVSRSLPKSAGLPTSICIGISVPHGEYQHAARMSGPQRTATLAWVDARTGFHRYREGYRLARPSPATWSRNTASRPTRRSLPRIWRPLALWTQPVTSAIELASSVTAAPPRRQFDYACYSMHQSVTGFLLRNDPLEPRMAGVGDGAGLRSQSQVRDVADLIMSQQRFIRPCKVVLRLSQPSATPSSMRRIRGALTGDRMNTMICLYWILKLKARSCRGLCRGSGGSGQGETGASRGSHPDLLLDYFYYTALTVAALYEKASRR